MPEKFADENILLRFLHGCKSWPLREKYQRIPVIPVVIFDDEIQRGDAFQSLNGRSRNSRRIKTHCMRLKEIDGFKQGDGIHRSYRRFVLVIGNPIKGDRYPDQ